MFKLQTKLNFLMFLPLDLNIQTVIFLKFLHYPLRIRFHHQFYLILVSITRTTHPRHLFNQIILRHIDRSTVKTQPDDEPFGFDLLSAVVEVQINETFHYKLLESFVFGPSFIDQYNLLLHKSNITVLHLSSIYIF